MGMRHLASGLACVGDWVGEDGGGRMYGEGGRVGGGPMGHAGEYELVGLAGPPQLYQLAAAATAHMQRSRVKPRAGKNVQVMHIIHSFIHGRLGTAMRGRG